MRFIKLPTIINECSNEDIMMEMELEHIVESFVKQNKQQSS